MTATLTPPLKWHGGKGYLAKRIVALFPPRDLFTRPWLHYCEPYAGGLSLLLANDPDGISEVINDIHGDLTNFWRVLRSPKLFPRFHRAVACVPFSEAEWRNASDPIEGESRVDRAVRFFIRCRQSLAGRMDAFTGITKTRTRGGMNGEASAWLSAVDGLPAVHERLRRVLILNRDALKVICTQDGLQTLFYCDPPYLPSTRTATNVYAHEMTLDDHRRLLRTLAKIKGRFLLSGYHSKLYDRFAARHGWTVHEFDLPNNAAGGKRKRRMIECVWSNF